jgi:[acyl-carrier-protein] S-malonyltransferase
LVVVVARPTSKERAGGWPAVLDRLSWPGIRPLKLGFSELMAIVHRLKPFEISDRLGETAFAFRGYNQTNLGRTPELLAHRVYGPVVERRLREASQICSDLSGRQIDLVSRVREKRESTLATFGEDIGLIISVELAQIELLEQHFNISYRQGRVALGYSLGEVTALVTSGVFNMAEVLAPLVAMADDSVELARDVTMGVVFSRGKAIDFDAIERLCLEITTQGRGMLAISSYLAPNALLVLGQGETVDRLKHELSHHLKGHVHLRKNSGNWPPLHTPLLWQRSIPNRAAMIMHSVGGGFRAPLPPVLSLVTGKTSYNDFNSRAILNRWTDEPQRLWDGIYELLSLGVEVIIHVGPDPNLLPATFKRLSDNVLAELSGRSLRKFGMRAVSNIISRPWIAKLLFHRAALLRAPYIVHINLEDWLLEQEIR